MDTGEHPAFHTLSSHLRPYRLPWWSRIVRLVLCSSRGPRQTQPSAGVILEDSTAPQSNVAPTMEARHLKGYETVMRVEISSDSMLIDTPVRSAPHASRLSVVIGEPLARPQSPDDEILEDAQALVEETPKSSQSDEEPIRRATEVEVGKSSNDDVGFYCTICCENREGEPIQPCWTCEEDFCGTCVRKMFLDASKDETSMPPRCCEALHLAYGRLVLSEEEVDRYRLKYEEWRSSERVYCPIPTCSAFLPARIFQRQRGADALLHCLACKVKLCGECKKIAHPERSCDNVRATANIDPELEDLLKQWGVKRCPRCKTGIRRMWGCHHMQCRCGAHFCWYCLGPIDKCLNESCPEAEASENYDTRINDAARLREDAEMCRRREAAARAADEPSAALPCAPQPQPAVNTQGTDGAIEAGDGGTTFAPYAPPIVNLDAGWFWEDASEDFGDEPTFDDGTGYYDCDHRWTSVVGKRLSPTLIFECNVCWRRIYPCVCGRTLHQDNQPSQGELTTHKGAAVCLAHPDVQDSIAGDHTAQTTAAVSDGRACMTRCELCNIIVCPECHDAELEKTATRAT